MNSVRRTLNYNNSYDNLGVGVFNTPSYGSLKPGTLQYNHLSAFYLTDAAQKIYPNGFMYPNPNIYSMVPGKIDLVYQNFPFYI